ncbi:3-oxoacyl-[acyl-carrier protein] reductase [Streptomyces sp. V4I23]|uniref:SDR family oxidoreductase n=1 Tax=Streptomyces sp. V4I23 TaxID=3042282 RepID=UPI0027888F5E|nr:SDR family oxidoreductase [Streptomyces sp. V4I23]MDQ1009256.1 3-oxoacyl-[acyl-carrier protein] reductase [Streptomyces sp. V4I23]
MTASGARTALVTGASRGIGRGIAQRLARDGFLVAVHYGSNDAAAKETVESIIAEGGQAFAVRADLAAGDGVAALYEGFGEGMAAQGAEPGLDVLVNNAALGPTARIDEVTEADFDLLFTVNVKAPFFLVQRGLGLLRDGGRVVNISSGVTRMAFPEAIAYSMTKGAVDTFTLALAKELAGRGITVNTVAPGFVETDMNAPLRSTPEGAAFLESFSAFGRIGQPADIADVVGFLASEESRWVTGQYIDATGGSRL